MLVLCRYVNAPGFYLSVVFMLLQLLTVCLVSNLSKEYDFKEHQSSYLPLSQHCDNTCRVDGAAEEGKEGGNDTEELVSFCSCPMCTP